MNQQSKQRPSERIREIMHEIKREFDLSEEVFCANNPGAAFGLVFNHGVARVDAIIRYLDEQAEKSK